MSLAILFIVHWAADFLLQDREMGQKKSESVRVLTKHIGVVTGALLIPAMLIFSNPIIGIWFCILNGLAHAVIDWNIWRFYKERVPKRKVAHLKDASHSHGFKFCEDEEFYSTIGADQCLHYLTLLILYNMLITFV